MFAGSEPDRSGVARIERAQLALQGDEPVRGVEEFREELPVTGIRLDAEGEPSVGALIRRHEDIVAFEQHRPLEVVGHEQHRRFGGDTDDRELALAGAERAASVRDGLHRFGIGHAQPADARHERVFGREPHRMGRGRVAVHRPSVASGRSGVRSRAR